MSIKVEHSVVAKCKPEHAWQKFSNITEWPWWNRAVGSAKWTQGEPWQRGSRFNLDLAYPTTIAFKSVISENGAPQSVAWNADGSGLSTTMRFEFQRQDDANTVLKAEADLSGWKTMFGGRSLQPSFKRMFEEWLDALKVEAEKIARESYARS